MNSNRRVQLPKIVRPLHYAVTLHPDLDGSSFVGEEEITLLVLVESSVVVLNVNDICVKRVVLVRGLEQYDVADISYNNAEQTVTLGFPVLMRKNESWMLQVQFEGTLNDQMAGFYRSKYEMNGCKKYMAVTQFEAADCRRAIPCFDEPALKATFDITLVVASHLTALSNCEITSDEPSQDGKKRIVKFARTPAMSTYLLAFAVGEFEYIEAYTNVTVYSPNAIRCRVYTTTGLSQHGRFALDVALRTLEYFSEIFGIPYPLTKCDQIAVPDFASGAMENWGLITYRTASLLIDDQLSSIQSKKWVSTTVTHELAHQWFGNLVTLQEWDELWLNEGFATWAGTLGADRLFPDWDIWTQFLFDDKDPALNLDGVRSSHPIQVEVLDPKEVAQIFDDISYSKGASVIHMLTNWLGVELFLKGVRYYLAKFQYANASTDDLWNALSHVSGQDVHGFMTIWTTVIGYPVLKVNEKTTSLGKRYLSFSQQRYLSTGDATEEEDKTIWPLPLNIAAGEPMRKVCTEVLAERSKDIEIILEDGSSPELYLVNYNYSGFYRVAYSKDILLRLSQAMKRGVIGVQDRFGLFGDAFNLARAGFQSTTGFLTLVMEALENESEYVIFYEVSQNLAELRSAWTGRSNAIDDKLRTLGRNVFASHAHQIGLLHLPTDTPLTKLLRPILIANAAYGGDQEIIKKCCDQYQLFVKDNNRTAIISDLYETVLSVAIVNGGETEINEVTHLFETTEDIELRYAALRALGYTKHPEMIQRVLSYSFSEHVRAQDAHYPWTRLSRNPLAGEAVWSFFQTKWNFLNERYKDNPDFLGAFIEISSHIFTSRQGLESFRKFFYDKDIESCQRKIDQSSDRIHGIVNWLERDGKNVDQWLLEQVQ